MGSAGGDMEVFNYESPIPAVADVREADDNRNLLRLTLSAFPPAPTFALYGQMPTL